MKSGFMWMIVIILLLVVGVLGWKAMTPTATTTDTMSTTTVEGGETGSETLSDRVVIDAPDSGATVPKTFTVTGKAPGNWYFEASFPIQVRDDQNNKVAQGIATALSDWMTVETVAFKADITVDSYTGPATLVLLRDNPSGLPENDDSISIPIVIQ